MKSVMQHSFSQVPRADIPRSSFNRTHGYKTCFDAGKLIPFYVDEAIPGDTFNLNATLLARLNTPIYPIMDNMFLDTFYFAVPIRLIWDNFQKMMGEQIDPGDSTDYLVPELESPTGGFIREGLEDYMGIPPKAGAGVSTISALWRRAYGLIWNEWFRDQNLQDSLTVPRDDGPDDTLGFDIMNRGKRHDYFTSALPWPQKGPGVELPLGDTAPIISNGNDVEITGGGLTDVNLGYGIGAGQNVFVSGTTTSADNLMFGTETGLLADLSGATAATINSLRQAFQMQKLLERDARGGTRYTEIIRSHFGTVSPDSRLQRPEYLGGGSTPVNINQVAQTSAQGSDFYFKSSLGDLGAFGVATSYNNGFTKSFTEHCVIIGLCNVRADLTYQQGIPKMFNRRSRFDFYWPALAHLGEQAILNKEIYHDQSVADDDVFGYQERWAEMRYYPSKITGKMRSSDPLTLDAWHLSQEFGSLPTLSDTFIQENPPIDRVVAVNTEPDFRLDCYIQAVTARPMPTYSVPGLIDHF